MADDAAKKAPPAKKSLPSELIMSAPVWKSTSVFGAFLARSSGQEPASPRQRAGVASMAGRTTRRFSTNAP
jgi:hypothetical protein